MSIQRKLAAIMFTDIAGYTEKMAKSEAAAINLLNKKDSILKPLLKKHNGNYVKSTGDGSLSYFNSAVDAATCAKKLQESLYDENLNVRIGVHLGDTIFEDNDIRGDGVNVASRLESMAISGSVFVSKEVYDQLINQPGFDGISLGVQSLKGVGRLIEVFGLKGDKLSEPNPEEYKKTQISIHEDEETPSLAIIPLKNKGADEDIFYAYGISADLIKECSSGGNIRVESLDNIETVENYDKLSAQELALKLSVRYISTGSLWKMGEMFQLSIEIYDTVKSKVVWSDRWQENWDNLTIIKAKLSDGLLKVLDTKEKTAGYIESNNTEAYEFYLKAKYKYEKRENKSDVEAARILIKEALHLDSHMFAAKSLYGTTYLQMGDYDTANEIFRENLALAETKDNQTHIANALSNIGIVYQFKGEYLEAIEHYLRSYSIQAMNSNKSGMSNTLGNMGTIYRLRGEYNKALSQFNKCLQIQEELGDRRSMSMTFSNIGNIYMGQAEYDDALKMYKKSLKICNEIKYKSFISIVDGNIALIYTKLGKYNLALTCQLDVLKLREELGDKRAIASTLNNIGTNYLYLGEYEKAQEYFNHSIVIKRKIEDKKGLAHSLFLIGVTYATSDNYEEANKFFIKSLDIQKEIGLKTGNLLLETNIHLNIIKKKFGEPNDNQHIIKLIEQTDIVYDYVLYFQLYKLFEEASYLNQSLIELNNLATELSNPDELRNLPVPKLIINESTNVVLD